MTSPDLTLGNLPPAPAAEPTAPPAVPTDEDEKKRRRRLIVLFLLGGLALIFIGIAFWYLLFRKPITQIIPPINAFNPPAYAYALYGLNHPNGVAVAPDGSRIYVTQSKGDQKALILDAKGVKVGELVPSADVAPGATQIYVAVNPSNGDVYTTDRVAGEVYVYGPDGTFKSLFEPVTLIPNFQPLGIGFGANGHLYVADVGGAYQRIHEFGSDGTLIRDIGAKGTFDYPNGIAGDSNGNVYVTDSNNGRVLVFDPSGAQIGIVPRGESAGELGLPRGIAIDPDGRVYVVDTTGGKVEVYRVFQNAQNRVLDFLGDFGVQGRGDGQFAYPNGGAVDSRGRVYVTDWANDRIQVWSY